MNTVKKQREKIREVLMFLELLHRTIISHPDYFRKNGGRNRPGGLYDTDIQTENNLKIKINLTDGINRNYMTLVFGDDPLVYDRNAVGFQDLGYGRKPIKRTLELLTKYNVDPDGFIEKIKQKIFEFS